MTQMQQKERHPCEGKACFCDKSCVKKKTENRDVSYWMKLAHLEADHEVGAGFETIPNLKELINNE